MLRNKCQSKSNRICTANHVSFWDVFIFLSLLAGFQSWGQEASPPPPATPVSASKPVQNLSPLAQAKTHYSSGNFKKASEILWNSIDTLNREGLILLVKCHQKLKEWGEVIKVSKLLIGKDSKDEEAHTYLGQALLMEGKEKEALENFKAATEINAVYQPAIDGLIQIYTKRKNLYELRVIYMDLVKKFGEKADFLNQLCDINTKDASNEEALDFCNRAIKKSPKVAENYVNLALVKQHMGNKEAASVLFKKAADQFPQSLFAQESLAQFLESTQDFIGSYKYYNNCLKIKPDNEACLVGVGISAAQIQKYDESYTILKKACSKNRNNAIAVRKVLQKLILIKKSSEISRFEALASQCLAN